jgi:acetyl-CoA carboxylase biotin carboxyl carrier protein
METHDLLELIERIDNSGLSRFHLREGEFELEIERNSQENGQSAAGRPADTAGKAAAGAAAGTAEAARGEAGAGAAPQQLDAAEGEKNGTETITSPIVGSFYRSPSPDAPPYVEPGREVTEGETLCIIEAMKVMNELEAEFPCRIVNVLAENQQMVEYGTPLFAVERLE